MDGGGVNLYYVNETWYLVWGFFVCEPPTELESFCGISYSVPSILRSNRFRRDARALEEDEEMWFNEDEEEEGEAVVPPVEKSKPEDDFPDSYEKFMETKKGISNFKYTQMKILIIVYCVFGSYVDCLVLMH